ncbi:MAG: hypothetical protein AB1603_05590 [Chloroflexota bacterium]
MDSEVASILQEIAADRSHGASWLSRRALEALRLAAERAEADSPRTLLTALVMVAGRLSEARSSMPGIANYSRRFLSHVREARRTTGDVEGLRACAIGRAQELARAAEKALTDLVQLASTIIRYGDWVLTCSYSSTVCQALLAAHERGKRFAVVAVESKHGGRAYGEAVAQALQHRDIVVELVADRQVAERMSRVARVLVGTDAILRDGSLVNGVPTLEVALAAERYDVPLYSLCETSKFHLHGEFKVEEGFQRVPPHLVTCTVTEEGVMDPKGAAAHIRGLLRAEGTTPGST